MGLPLIALCDLLRNQGVRVPDAGDSVPDSGATGTGGATVVFAARRSGG